MTSDKDMTVEAKFEVGDYVQRVNQPELAGIVRELRWDAQVESWNYLVQFGAQLRAVPEEALETVSVVESPWESFEQGSLSGKTHFVFTLTYERLKSPPARIAHSFATARTQFYPYQFKPLLKFLDNPGKSVLIADDVGLGKTIEAAYILRELDAHQAIERVLIVVPARLRSKWERELRQRFGEQFKQVRGADLIEQANRVAKGRELEEFRWITSFESVRSEEVRSALDEVLIPIDVLIVDEAHRLRNPETLQHKVGIVLTRSATAVVFLTATPVQNKLEDLWNLLKLLSPDEFSEWALFQDQVKGNRLILAAQNALANHPPNYGDAKEAVESFIRQHAPERAGRQFLATILERLADASSDRRECLELQADISRLSPTSHIISRTRKNEALPNRPKRDPHWQRVLLTEEERAIYDGVEEICRKRWPGTADSWGFQMSLMMAYRMTASCIPAALQYFADKLKETEQAAEPFSDEDSSGSQEAEEMTAWVGPARQALKQIVEFAYHVPEHDSKLEELVRAFNEIWEDDQKNKQPRRKIVVFSFFRRTLEYLALALRERAIPNRMIHGGVPIDDRETAIDDFLERNDILVLLTSEVGGEGIDLQAASVLFNYDLPWNPMVVEQRIGRIDRIGQQAKRLVILNFVVESSIEERVLARLLTKIEIFKESIGEPDPIIGEEIEKLTGRALQGDLSPEELDRLVEQQGDALAHRVLEAKKMLTRVDGLLAADQALIDEINAIIGERQLPSEHELVLFLNSFLANRYPGTQLPSRVVEDVVSVNLGSNLGFALENSASELGHDAAMFGRRISTGPVDVTLSREAGYRHPRAELIHLQHPLTRFAVSGITKEKSLKNAAFALSLSTKRLPAGRYGFLVSLIHVRTQRSLTKLVALFADWDGDKMWADPDEATALLIEMLEKGNDLRNVPQLDGTAAVKERLVTALNELKRDWEKRGAKLEQARLEQQSVSRLAILDFRVNRIRERLTKLQASGANEFAIRMTTAQLSKADQERDLALKNSKNQEWGAIEHEEIAVGFLEVPRTDASFA
jgi:SNF2 family DNA or RNA helicase